MNLPLPSFESLGPTSARVSRDGHGRVTSPKSSGGGGRNIAAETFRGVKDAKVADPCSDPVQIYPAYPIHDSHGYTSGMRFFHHFLAYHCPSHNHHWMFHPVETPIFRRIRSGGSLNKPPSWNDALIIALETKSFPSGCWLGHPSEKYESQLG